MRRCRRTAASGQHPDGQQWWRGWRRRGRRGASRARRWRRAASAGRSRAGRAQGRGCRRRGLGRGGRGSRGRRWRARSGRRGRRGRRGPCPLERDGQRGDNRLGLGAAVTVGDLGRGQVARAAEALDDADRGYRALLLGRQLRDGALPAQLVRLAHVSFLPSERIAAAPCPGHGVGMVRIFYGEGRDNENRGRARGTPGGWARPLPLQADGRSSWPRVAPPPRIRPWHARAGAKRSCWLQSSRFSGRGLLPPKTATRATPGSAFRSRATWIARAARAMGRSSFVGRSMVGPDEYELDRDGGGIAYET